MKQENYSIVLFDARYIEMTGIGTYVKAFIHGALNHNATSQIAFLFSKKHSELPFKKALEEKKYPIYEISSLPFQLFEHIEFFFYA